MGSDTGVQPRQRGCYFTAPDGNLDWAVPEPEIDTMKKQDGKDMIVFGSGTIVSELTKHSLVDEYQFVVSPLLLGSGRQMIAGLDARTRLTLLEAKPYQSGNVVLRYSRALS